MTAYSRVLKCIALSALALAGCSHQTESPPVSASTQSGATAPDLVCAEQLTTAVALLGSGFTPMPSKTLAGGTQLILPSIVMSLKTGLDGTPGDGTFAIPDSAAQPASSRVRWVSEQQMSFDVFPDLSLTPGLYDITVTNPDHQKNTVFAGALAAVPRPTVTLIAPDILCDAEHDQTVTLTGSGLLSVGGMLPTVHIGGNDLQVTKVMDCVDVPGTHSAGAVQTCSTAILTIPKGTLDAGRYDVTLTNPAAAACVSTDKLSLTVVPPPALVSVAPDLACDAQGDQKLIITGTGFLKIGKDLPSVALGGQVLTASGVSDCAEITTGPFVEGKVSSCRTLSFTVSKGSLDTGDYPLVVTNPAPADCESLEKTVKIHIAPPPTVTTVQADLVCDAQSAQDLTLTGTGFLKVGKDLPAVQVGTQMLTPTGADGCKNVTGPFEEGTVQSCTQLSFSLPKGAFDPGDYPVVVTNPDPAGCHSVEVIQVHVSPPPTVTAVQADLLCDAQAAQAMTVTGTGLLKVGTMLPTIQLGTQMLVPTAADGCTDVATFAEGVVQSCTKLSFSLPQGALAAGDYPIVVTNPDPAGCHSEDVVQVHVAAPPAVLSLDKTAICDAEANQVLTINGTDFLQVGAALPAVMIGTVSFVPTAGGCTPVGGTFAEGAVQVCTSLTVTVAKDAFGVGDFPVLVTNPATAECASTQTVSLHVEGPPSVASVAPATVCTGGRQIQINGSGFAASPSVSLVAAGKATVLASASSSNAAGTQLTAQIGAGAEVGTTYDLVVTNPDSCSDLAPHKTVTVVAGPLVYLADPEVVYSGINTAVTVYATGLTLPVSNVSIVPAGKLTPATVLTWTPVAGHPNRGQILIPKGQAVGAYDLLLTDATTCTTVLPNALTVTGSLTVSLKSIVPPFGWSQSETPVTIKRDTAAASPANKPFVATPRAFLNPTNAAASDVAIPLESVAFSDADTLTAVVPKDQTVHAYDLIVVNSDGSVGLLPNAFTVETLVPPTIDAVTFSSMVAATAQGLTVTGKDFRASTIGLACVDAAGVAEAAPPVTPGAITCDVNQKCSQPVSVDASALAVGSTCVVRLTNSDKSYAEFSAVGVTNSSLNLSSPKAGPNMVVGRRALSSAAADATSAARFVYAIGGDGGSAVANAPFASVEFAPVDLYGNIGAFSLASNSLDAGRSFTASAQMGRYIYLMGGSDGTKAVNTARRAMILNPREVPSVDVDDIVPAAAGLDPGYWFYRVATTFTAADTDNPLGESLASDEFIVKVPTFPGKKIQVVLKWTAPVDSLGAALPNVAGYRVYRTASVNGASGQEVLLTTTGAGTLTYTDDATLTPGTAKPLPLGSTGHWATLPNLGTPRKGAAGAAAFDPAVAGQFYVYGLLGVDATNTVLTSYEYLTVKIGANDHQTVTAGWTPGAKSATAGTGRFQLGAWVADSTTAKTITAPDTFVFIGGGTAADGTTGVKAVQAGKVLTGGDLGTIVDTSGFSTTAAGYGVCAANGQLFTFGGQQAVPSAGAKSAQIGKTSNPVAPPPALENGAWNSEGLTMTHSRFLLGSSVQSSFIFLLGGQTETDAASRTSELVIW